MTSRLRYRLPGLLICSLAAGFIGTLWLTIPTEQFFAIGVGTALLAAVILYWMGRTRTGVSATN